MDTDSFIIHIKTENVYEGFADEAGKRFDTSNYEVDRPLPKGINKKVIGLMKDGLGGKIITEFVALRPKACSYLIDDGNKYKKVKETKKYVIKRISNHQTKCLFDKKTILQLQQRFKSEAHNVYTEEINKIALSSNDDKRVQTFDNINMVSI